MFGLSKFFGNIQNAFAKEFVFRNKIKLIIKEVSGLEIKIEDITQKDGVVILKNQTPAFLSVIFVKKTKLLNLARQQSLNIVDIR